MIKSVNSKNNIICVIIIFIFIMIKNINIKNSISFFLLWLKVLRLKIILFVL